MRKVFHFCWRPLPGNFYARASCFIFFICCCFFHFHLCWLILFFSVRKFAANLEFCIFISSGFGFNVVPRKLPKFNRVNDKVFSLLLLLFVIFFSYIINNKSNNNNNDKRCKQKLRRRQVLNLALVQSWPFDACLNNGQP